MTRKPTETELLQKELLRTITQIFEQHDLAEIELKREDHIEYIEKGFNSGFPSVYVSLDSSRPWLVYWALQSFDLLGRDLEADERIRCLETIRRFQSSRTGGFCGGDAEATQQMAHLAPTYASLLSLAILADPEGYRLINRPALRSFLKSLKLPNGPFRMHQIDGEIDVRATYCAIVAGKLTACWDEELDAGVVDWILSCQTWEGGFAGVPGGAEAHGGYTFCALAALNLLDRLHLIKDPTSLIHWLLSQQVDPLGGFRGRTNKLVDACYSFWMGASFDCIGAAKLFDSAALQQFILAACQDPKGGLRDKPGKSSDFYHTCYALSGLSLAQHQISDPEFILGGPTNLLKAIDSRYNLIQGKAEAMIHFFSCE